MKTLHLKWVSFRHWNAIGAKSSYFGVRWIRYPLKTYPTLNTEYRVTDSDEPSIVTLSAYLRQKTDKSPKTGSALVPFKRMSDAFAAVCASERKAMGMDGVKVSWVKVER